MLVTRTLWKDWGFAPSLFDQARGFLDSAKQLKTGNQREGLIRASIVFSLASLEAYFYEVIKGYIQQNETKLSGKAANGFKKLGSVIFRIFSEGHRSGLEKVRTGMARHAGIHEAVKDWPKLLTGKSLDTNSQSYKNFVNFTKYRNLLLHGQITEKIPSWGKLAQEVETIGHAELAHTTVSEMAKMLASHFGFDDPTWS